MNEYNKAIDTATHVRRLEQRIRDMERSFCQTVLAIVTAMPDDDTLHMPVVRISKFDYQRCVGRELTTYTDPATGDQVFVSRPLLPAKDEAAS